MSIRPLRRGRYWLRLGLLLLSGLLAGCFFSLDGSLVGKKKDGGADQTVEQTLDQ
jgi:hypothetical protein